jgi:fructose-1,6-bisphosphatase/inositol monophosphatase family enzyme/predicted metal-dependent phosphoesterase TrpH
LVPTSLLLVHYENMTGDLHIHSRHSDGTRTTTEILSLARERGLSYLSIADQNTTAGTAEAIETGARIGLTVVPGVEISAFHSATGSEVHILGYGFRLPADTIDETCRLASDAGNRLPEASEAIRAIHTDRGFAVLAHPGQSDAYAAVDDLVSAGLDGIEIYHPDHGPSDHGRIQAVAGRHGLFVTGGSDGGGQHGGHQEIGDIHAPFGSLSRLIRQEDELVAWAEALVREAGAMARRAVLSEIETELKGGSITDIVTQHDMAIERFLIDSIRNRFPDHGFITEEHEHPPVEADMPAWIIDPIDGTTNFVSTHDHFAVSLAHYRGTKPVFGIVYNVMADELFIGIAGGGAWLNGRSLRTIPKPMHDSMLEISLVCSHRIEDRFGADTRAIGRELRGQRAFGSAAIGICRIATGTIDMYMSCSLSLWDYAAAVIVLTEAGGRIAVEEPDAPNPGTRSSMLEPVSAPIIYHDDKRLLMAAGDLTLLNEVSSRLFPGPKRPSMALLAPTS